MGVAPGCCGLGVVLAEEGAVLPTLPGAFLACFVLVASLEREKSPKSDSSEFSLSADPATADAVTSFLPPEALPPAFANGLAVADFFGATLLRDVDAPAEEEAPFEAVFLDEEAFLEASEAFLLFPPPSEASDELALALDPTFLASLAPFFLLFPPEAADEADDATEDALLPRLLWLL